MAVYRFVLAPARLPQRQQVSNESVKKRRAVLRTVCLFFLPLRTVAQVVPCRTAVMQGSILRAQPGLPQFAAQEGDLSRLPADSVCMRTNFFFCLV